MHYVRDVSAGEDACRVRTGSGPEVLAGMRNAILVRTSLWPSSSCTVRMAAWGLVRGKSYLGAYLRRQRSRLGTPKAVTATAHKLARIVYHLVRYGAAYVKKSEDEFAEQVRGRVERAFHRRAKELGYEVRKVEPSAPAEATVG